jgi:hypothetical protein
LHHGHIEPGVVGQLAQQCRAGLQHGGADGAVRHYLESDASVDPALFGEQHTFAECVRLHREADVDGQVEQQGVAGVADALVRLVPWTTLPWARRRPAIRPPSRQDPPRRSWSFRLPRSAGVFDVGYIRVAELEAAGAEYCVDLVGPTEADDRSVYRWIAQPPGRRDRASCGVLCRAATVWSRSTRARCRDSCGSTKPTSCLRQSSSARLAIRSRVIAPVSSPEPIGE